MRCADRSVLYVLATRTRRPQRLGAFMLLRLSDRLRRAHISDGGAVALGLGERQLRAERADAEQSGVRHRTRWPIGRVGLNPHSHTEYF